MPVSLDPLALVTAAKHRHYAYKSPSQASGILGQDYLPPTIAGKDITSNPAGAAALAAQGIPGTNRPQVGQTVAPNAGAIPQGFADGGEVIGKVTKTIQALLDKFGPSAVPTAAAAPAASELRSHVVDPRKLQALRAIDPSTNQMVQGYQTAVSNGDVPDSIRSALANKLQSVSPQEKLRRVASQENPLGGMDPYNTSDALAGQKDTENLLSSALANTPDKQMAEGGSTDHEDVQNSSLKWIADMARKLGKPNMSEDRARVASGVAKQFYGLDENGQPVLGGQAWTPSQHGTPPRILDELTSIPGGLAHLFSAINPKPKDVASQTGHDTSHSIKWLDDAASRVANFDKAATKETGVGEAHTWPEHIEDAATMLATPFPASKVAGEAPAMQRLFEYLTPVRPPTLARYGADSAVLGSASAGLDKLADHLASKKAAPQPVDSDFEDAAVNSTNAGFAGGGEITRRAILKLLGASAASVPVGLKVLEQRAEPEASEALAKVAAKVKAPVDMSQALQRVKDEAFGASDEPNWHFLDRYLPTLPGHEKVLPQYQAMKELYHSPASPLNASEDTTEAENALGVKVHQDFEKSLDDLAVHHGVDPAVNPNE